MLPLHYFSCWSLRDKRRGWRLAKFLRIHGRHHRLHLVSRLGAQALNASNAFARTRFRRELATRLFKKLDACEPDFIPARPVWFLTVVAKDMVAYPGTFDRYGEPIEPTARQLQLRFRSLLRGLNYVGMIEPALYVSTQKVFGVPRLISYHVHVLVWGIDKRLLAELCEELQRRVSPLIPYTSVAVFKRVRRRDLRQVLWYSTKMPREQTQCSRNPETKRISSWSRPLNGINAVRLFEETGRFTLRDLAIADGEGTLILARSLAALEPPSVARGR